MCFGSTAPLSASRLYRTTPCRRAHTLYMCTASLGFSGSGAPAAPPPGPHPPPHQWWLQLQHLLLGNKLQLQNAEKKNGPLQTVLLLCTECVGKCKCRLWASDLFWRVVHGEALGGARSSGPEQRRWRTAERVVDPMIQSWRCGQDGRLQLSRSSSRLLLTSDRIQNEREQNPAATAWCEGAIKRRLKSRQLCSQETAPAATTLRFSGTQRWREGLAPVQGDLGSRSVGVFHYVWEKDDTPKFIHGLLNVQLDWGSVHLSATSCSCSNATQPEQ